MIKSNLIKSSFIYNESNSCLHIHFKSIQIGCLCEIKSHHPKPREIKYHIHIKRIK